VYHHTSNELQLPATLSLQCLLAVTKVSTALTIKKLKNQLHLHRALVESHQPLAGFLVFPSVLKSLAQEWLAVFSQNYWYAHGFKKNKRKIENTSVAIVVLSCMTKTFLKAFRNKLSKSFAPSVDDAKSACIRNAKSARKKNTKKRWVKNIWGCSKNTLYNNAHL